MKRHACQPRADWREKVESVGLTFHSHESGPYWDESACYELTAGEVNELEIAANKLHYLCIDAAEAVIKNNWWSRLGIQEKAAPVILKSWERDDFSLYGRFDLSYDGITPPKLLEYNADTPTALVESAVAQWFWLQETHPHADQFNSIHERLIEAWKRWQGKMIHFSGIKGHAEDEMTVLYLRDTCEQAGVKTKSVCIEEIGWHEREHHFVDLDNERIERAFKLYPWEWLWGEEFGQHLTRECVQFIEPAWKMLLSNKGLLPVLWELFPGHPNLLPAFDSAEPLGGRYIRKPILSREGSNVSWVEGGVVVEENGGKYGEEGFVFQSPADLPDFGGNHPVFGVWVVDHEAAGMGIREDTRRITGNLSRFVPHFFT
ncbi:MAG TPA: glutathionylspermidine synthase family protein [Candidatus Acidoferrales bacterium]|jgi:glutathionylspermidine synthase|nr:glutathionylspermidine synthase family protein [Candidatus Acidoferrales bacterium]